jgi:hypothetical protein
LARLSLAGTSDTGSGDGERTPGGLAPPAGNAAGASPRVSSESNPAVNTA